MLLTAAFALPFATGTDDKAYADSAKLKAAAAYTIDVSDVIASDAGSYPQIVYNGHTYQVFPAVISTYEGAKNACISLGGHLATITSQSENDAVHRYLRLQGVENAYFGLHFVAAR
jgi:hypothetical protein